MVELHSVKKKRKKWRKKWIQCVWLREEAIFPMMLGTGRAMQDNVVDNNVVVLLIVLSI
jgi:hypothetical protein